MRTPHPQNRYLIVVAGGDFETLRGSRERFEFSERGGDEIRKRCAACEPSRHGKASLERESFNDRETLAKRGINDAESGPYHPRIERKSMNIGGFLEGPELRSRRSSRAPPSR